MITTPITLPTTDEKVSVKARCASITSLLRRVTSAPVWVRVKNAMGMRWMCAKTCVRRSKMRPSPIRAEIQRCHRLRPDVPTTASHGQDAGSTSWTTRPGPGG